MKVKKDFKDIRVGCMLRNKKVLNKVLGTMTKTEIKMMLEVIPENAKYFEGVEVEDDKGDDKGKKAKDIADSEPD